jgi:hypothetical protein
LPRLRFSTEGEQFYTDAHSGYCHGSFRQVFTDKKSKIARARRYSASFASPPCGEWQTLLRHRNDRPELNPLALGRPQIPAQVSAPVRPGEVLPRLNAGRFGFPRGRGRPAPTEANKDEIGLRKILVGGVQGALAPTSCETEQLRSKKPRLSGAVSTSAISQIRPR